MKKNLLHKFMSFSYGSWIGLVLGVVITIITTRLLQPEALGKASMFELFLQVGLIFIILGTDQSFTRFFYEEREENRGGLLYNSLKLPILSFTVVSIFIIIFNQCITNFILGIVNIKFALMLIVGLLSQLIFRYGQLVIRMQQKGNLYSLVQIIQRVLNLMFIIILFYYIGDTFEVIIYSSVFTLLLMALIVIIVEKDFWSIKNLDTEGVKHSQKDVVKFGFPFVFTLFITWLFESFDKVGLRYWSDFDELGIYSAAMRLIALVVVLKETFRTFWTPVSYEKYETTPQDTVFFENISKVVTFVMFAVAIFSIMAKDVIVLLLGRDYHDAALLMPFLVFIPLFYTISETTVIGINFVKKTKWHIFIAFVSCTINIIGNWLLIPEYGALGASISTAFSYVIFFTLRTTISKKYYYVKYPLYRIYLMGIILALYGIFVINNESVFLNIILGIGLIIILFALFSKEVNDVFKLKRKLL